MNGQVIHPSGVRGPMERVGQDGDVELVFTVAARRDVAGSDQLPAARFAWYTRCA